MSSMMHYCVLDIDLGISDDFAYPPCLAFAAPIDPPRSQLGLLRFCPDYFGASTVLPAQYPHERELHDVAV